MPATLHIAKRHLLVSLLTLLAAHPLAAQTTPLGSYGEADTTWPGLKLIIRKLVRTDPTHVLVLVALVAGPSAPAHTMVGEFPKTFTVPLTATRADIESGKYSAKFYSLAESKLIDETSLQQFKAEKNLPPQPSLAPISTVELISRNSGTVLSVYFPVPPPQPPGRDGKIPPQLVTILFPKAAKAIEHVPLPLPEPAPAQPGAPAAAAPSPAPTVPH